MNIKNNSSTHRAIPAVQSLPVTVASPDGRIVATIESGTDGSSVYSLHFGTTPILHASTLGLELAQGGLLAAGLELTGIAQRSVNETYPIIAGKAKSARNHFNETTLGLQETRGDRRKLNIIVRAYNDGIAFRYSLPKQPGLSTFEVTGEKTDFRFPEDAKCWALRLEKYTTPYESEFVPLSLDTLTPGEIIGLPLTIQFANGTVVALAEADLHRYAGMYVSGLAGVPHGVATQLAPRTDGSPFFVKENTPHVTPWRVVMVADAPGRLIESTLIANLNPTCAIKDTSWIKPGKSAWSWWTGEWMYDNVQGKVDTTTMNYYIDFAADMKFEYMTIDVGWYSDWTVCETADVTQCAPNFDLKAVIAHANKKKVGLFLWMHWKRAQAQMDQAFPLYRKLGIKGVKVDFMDSDSQETVEFYHRVVSTGAKHKLLVNLHGAYKPTGLYRTWPNYITQEGVMGAEYNQWSTRINAQHTITLPFTRMLVGPMDFTPGCFRTRTLETFVIPKGAPTQALGTRCRQLAMFVIYDSYLQTVCDFPGSMRGQDGANFLSAVPTTWDETRVLTGEIAQYIVMARRSGKEWYIGAMTNDAPRSLTIPLSFLSKGSFMAEIYCDGDRAATTPTHIATSTQTVTRATTLTLSMAAAGGFVARLRPQR